MSTEVATEHVETLLAAAEELAEACVMIAKQLRPRPSDPVTAQTTRPPSILRAATLLDQAAGATGDTRRLLRSTLMALAQAARGQPANGADPEPAAEASPAPGVAA